MSLGPCVDQVVDATELVSTFGPDSFDVVLTTEMLEHAFEWREVISNLKHVLRPGGILLLTTRSLGFARHYEHPGDFWRYEIDDMSQIFSDFEIIELSSDPMGSGGGPGVFMKARKPQGVRYWVEKDLSDIYLHSMEGE